MVFFGATSSLRPLVARCGKQVWSADERASLFSAHLDAKQCRNSFQHPFPVLCSVPAFRSSRREVGCTISSFICLSAGEIEWQPCFFAIIILIHVPPKVRSVLVLFLIFGGFFISLFL